MTDEEIAKLLEEQNQEGETEEVDSPENQEPESVPSDMEESVEMTAEGKVREAPAGFEGLITEDQDALSEAARKHQIVLEGVCSHCAHCGMPLRDAVSVQRGIGPICSKKGYFEEPEDTGDPVEAMMFLSKWPHLVNFLVKNSEGLEEGKVRGLLNGLVRICSLNRRTDVHDACTDAIETLGFNRLASMLRESLSIAELRDSKNNPSFWALWIKKSEWTPKWRYDFRQMFPQSRFSREDKGMLVEKTNSNRRQLWGLLNRHYNGLCLKTPEGKAVRIQRKKKGSDNTSN